MPERQIIGHNNLTVDPGDIPFTVTSTVGARDHEPSIVIQYGRQSGAVPPDRAREIAMMLLETAEACEHDAFIVDHLMKERNMPRVEAMEWLRGFRTHRALRQRRAWIVPPDPSKGTTQ